MRTPLAALHYRGNAYTITWTPRRAHLNQDGHTIAALPHTTRQAAFNAALTHLLGASHA